MSSYRVLCVAVGLSVIALTRLCLQVEGGTMKPIELVKKHMNYVNTFRCQPQPRSYLARTLLGDQVSEKDLIRPFYTLLHRCDIHSGCCNVDHQCSPSGRPDQVTLWFFVNNTYKSVKAYNHTQCECLPLINLPKR